MANLKEIAELAWSQLFPNPGDEAAVDREDFVATAKSEYAYQLWRKMKEDKREFGDSEIPSYLLTTTELEVSNDVMDISPLNILRSLDNEQWLQNIGGLSCECDYIKSSVNHWKALCDDDSLPEDARIFIPIGKQIRFPLGVHKTPLEITYANNGEDIDDEIEVDDVIGGIVRRSLVEIYGGKIGKEDVTNNTNLNQ